MKVHPFIDAEKIAGHGVQRACRLLEVSRAAYYQRRNGAGSPRAVADAAITARITSIHQESGGTYGSPRVHRALQSAGVVPAFDVVEDGPVQHSSLNYLSPAEYEAIHHTSSRKTA